MTSIDEDLESKIEALVESRLDQEDLKDKKEDRLRQDIVSSVISEMRDSNSGNATEPSDVSRRSFLKFLGVGTGGLLLPSAATAAFANFQAENQGESQIDPGMLTFNLSSHKLDPGQFTSMHRFTVPNGSSLEVYEVSVQNSSINTPSGLNLVIRDNSANTNIATFNNNYRRGSPVSRASVGGNDVTFLVDNGDFTSGTGSTQVVNAFIRFKVI